MAGAESELEMVRRHVAQGERHLLDQHRIIEHFRRIGGSTQLAEQLLAEFERTLQAHRDHLDRIQSGIEQADEI